MKRLLKFAEMMGLPVILNPVELHFVLSQIEPIDAVAWRTHFDWGILNANISHPEGFKCIMLACPSPAALAHELGHALKASPIFSEIRAEELVAAVMAGFLGRSFNCLREEFQEELKSGYASYVSAFPEEVPGLRAVIDEIKSRKTLFFNILKESGDVGK